VVTIGFSFAAVVIKGGAQKQDREDIMYFHISELWFECVIEDSFALCASPPSRMTLFFLFCLAFFNFGLDALLSTKDIIAHMDN
jgi:hypothetical protein